jgi:hypothetical protein
MGLQARILAVTTETGPRKRSVLEGLCRTDRQRRTFTDIFQRMQDSGALVMFGQRRGATYGPPKRKWK